MKFPITLVVLCPLCNSVSLVGFLSLDAMRLVAMFVLAFHAFLWAGKICGSGHAISLDDVFICDSYLVVQFPSYKSSAGRCPSVFIPSHPMPWCPVKVLTSYSCMRDHVRGPLFLDSSGKPISLLCFHSELAKVVQVANLGTWGIMPHSFWVGVAMSPVALGIVDETINRMGRWTSRAFYCYIKFQINRFLSPFSPGSLYHSSLILSLILSSQNFLFVFSSPTSPSTPYVSTFGGTFGPLS